MMVDDEILALLGGGDLAEGERAYARLFHMFRRFFEWRGCSDPEGLAQTVFERGLERLRNGAEIRETNIGGYLYGFAKVLLHEDRRARRTVALDTPGVVEMSRNGGAEEALLIRQLLGALAPEERKALIGYIHGNRQGVPGETPAALRIRVFRIRKKLMDLLNVKR